MSTTLPAGSTEALNAARTAPLPDWFPPWAHQLADAYFARTASVFVLHGNVHDLVAARAPGGWNYVSAADFLGAQLFGSWDVVLGHDLGRGLKALAGASQTRLLGMMQYLTARWGEPGGWPREPEKIFALIDQLVDRLLLDDPADRKSLAVVFEYAQYLAPAGDLTASSVQAASRLVRLLHWAQNPHIRRQNIAFCLIADRLAEVNNRLVENPYVSTIEIPLPDESRRRQFIEWASAGENLAQRTDFSCDELAKMSNGLSLVNLNVVISEAIHSRRRIDAQRFRQLKKSMIERQCRDLVEFVEPTYTLDLVVGYEEAKKRLRQDAEWILRGRTEAAPMGYLVCGPVGTGKTFLAECYAGSIGIPCVVLRNFRSKYVGETEGNLQQVLTVLRSLGPVVVIVDEADAALGNRRAEGDSGTSARVFSMIAAQMGDTRYRGKIIWMLLTSRPDLLPIDLKRQGRAEVHIPLMYPRKQSEISAMFAAMARKNKLRIAPEAVPAVDASRRLTGADIESIVLAARRLSLADGREEVSGDDLRQALDDFVPSAQGLEKEMQEIAAVLECTQRSFLPEEYQQKLAQPDGVLHLQQRLVAIRQLMGEGVVS